MDRHWSDVSLTADEERENIAACFDHFDCGGSRHSEQSESEIPTRTQKTQREMLWSHMIFYFFINSGVIHGSQVRRVTRDSWMDNWTLVVGQ